MHNYEKLLQLYTELYVGKEAIYQSKYGGYTKGIVVERIHMGHLYIPDLINNMAHRLEIQFISTKGSIYNLNELYFINND